MKIKEGLAGEESLDDLCFAVIGSWPKALHFGGGACRLIIDEKASAEKRALIEKIAMGKLGGRPWPIFAATFDKWLESLYLPFDWKFDGASSHVVAGEALRVYLAPMRNPVTGKEVRARIELPDGLLTKYEDVTTTQTFSVFTDGLKFAWPGRNAWYGTVKHGN